MRNLNFLNYRQYIRTFREAKCVYFSSRTPPQRTSSSEIKVKSNRLKRARAKRFWNNIELEKKNKK